MSGIIGKKVGMTSMFSEEGKNVPCTVIEAGPCYVSQIKTVEKDGYEATQLAYGEKSERQLNGAQKGHFKKAKIDAKAKLVEFGGFEDVNLGDAIGVDHFEEGDYVDVSGTSKGKGFQGVVKRHNFAGVGGQTHGQHNRLRAPGSIGAASWPARVFKGMKMAGRTGGDTIKVENLRILKVVPEKNIVVVSGCVPGSKGSYVIIEK